MKVKFENASVIEADNVVVSPLLQVKLGKTNKVADLVYDGSKALVVAVVYDYSRLNDIADRLIEFKKENNFPSGMILLKKKDRVPDITDRKRYANSGISIEKVDSDDDGLALQAVNKIINLTKRLEVQMNRYRQSVLTPV